MLLTSDGVLVAGYRWREERSTAVIWSHDLGRTWEGPKIIDRVLGGYPSLVELPDGRVLMVYYTEGAGSDIRGVFLDASADGVEVLTPHSAAEEQRDGEANATAERSDPRWPTSGVWWNVEWPRRDSWRGGSTSFHR
jgi:hypothetical protein